MRNLICRFGFPLLVLILLAPSVTYAADKSVEVTITIDPVFKLLATGDLNWSGSYWAPDADDYNADVTDLLGEAYETAGYGCTDPKSLTLYIWANYKWELFIKGTGGLTFTGGDGDKPVGDIMWMDGKPHGFHPLTDSKQSVFKGPAPWAGNDPGFNDHVDVTFVVLLHWLKDHPGTYNYDSVQFTIASQ